MTGQQIVWIGFMWQIAAGLALTAAFGWWGLVLALVMIAGTVIVAVGAIEETIEEQTDHR